MGRQAWSRVLLRRRRYSPNSMLSSKFDGSKISNMVPKVGKSLAKVKNIAKKYDNVCIYAQKVVSLRKISNIKTKSNEKRTITKT